MSRRVTGIPRSVVEPAETGSVCIGTTPLLFLMNMIPARMRDMPVFPA